MRGITPVIAIIMLVVIAVAVVGLAYGFIMSVFSGATGKVVVIGGASSCSDGAANIRVTNAGTGTIAEGDMSVTRTVCSPSRGCPTVQPVFEFTKFPLKPDESGGIKESSNLCGKGHSCQYVVNVGAGSYATMARCAS